MNVPNLSLKGTHFGTQWFREGVMYEVFVRSFRDSNGDGIGDLRGVIEGLDYIQSLGATIIWLMPIHPSPSYHGYDVTDYYAVNPDYGTMDDMLELIQAVHNRGMYIIMDYVANHTSNHHPFYRDAFNNLASEYGSFYRWKNDAHTAVRGFGGSSAMPDVNFDDAAVRQYMIDVARYWLDPNGDGNPSDGFDGLRCDMATGPPLDFWAELRTAMLNLNPNSVLLAEAWLRSTGELQEYLTTNSFNAIFDFPTFHAVAADHNLNGDGIVSGTVSSDFLRIAFKNAQIQYPIDSHLVRFINNHDTNRIMSEVEGDETRARASAVWLLTAPGTPMLYYGEEIGMFGVKGTGHPYWDESRREPFKWFAAEEGDSMTMWFLPPDRHNSPNDGISVEEQDNNPASLLNFYRKLISLRHTTHVIKYGDLGNIIFSSAGGDLYGIWRGNTNEEFVVIIINFGLESVTSQFLEKVPNVKNLNILISESFVLHHKDSFTIDPSGYAIIRCSP
jgi:glycosidase